MCSFRGRDLASCRQRGRFLARRGWRGDCTSPIRSSRATASGMRSRPPTCLSRSRCYRALCCVSAVVALMPLQGGRPRRSLTRCGDGRAAPHADQRLHEEFRDTAAPHVDASGGCASGGQRVRPPRLFRAAAPVNVAPPACSANASATAQHARTARNFLCLVRLLSNYFVAMLDHHQLSALYNGKPMPGSTVATPGSTVATGAVDAAGSGAPWKVEVLVAEIIDCLVELTNRQPPTDELYAELVLSLLVLCSTQVYQPSASRAHHNYFLDMLLERFTCARTTWLSHGFFSHRHRCLFVRQNVGSRARHAAALQLHDNTARVRRGCAHVAAARADGGLALSASARTSSSYSY